MKMEESAKLDARYRICNKNGKGTWYLQHYEPDIKTWIDLPKMTMLSASLKCWMP